MLGAVKIVYIFILLILNIRVQRPPAYKQPLGGFRVRKPRNAPALQTDFERRNVN